MAFPTVLETANPAARIAHALTLAINSNSRSTVLDAWCYAFDVSNEISGLAREHEVAQLLSECLIEIRLLSLGLQLQQVPENLYGPYVSRMSQIFSVSNLNSAWQTAVSNHLGNEVMLVLAWCSHVLPQEAGEGTAEELEALERALTELQAALDAPGVPEPMRVAFAKHLAGMSKALRLFPLRGAAPMKAAARVILADLNIDKDEIRTVASQGDSAAVKTLGQKFEKAFKKTAELSGDAEKIIKVGKPLVEFVYESIQKISG